MFFSLILNFRFEKKDLNYLNKSESQLFLKTSI